MPGEYEQRIFFVNLTRSNLYTNGNLNSYRG
jgi:hypothetical protein